MKGEEQYYECHEHYYGHPYESGGDREISSISKRAYDLELNKYMVPINISNLVFSPYYVFSNF
jgi:hypothetical protein